jgi:hypothetical protein
MLADAPVDGEQFRKGFAFGHRLYRRFIDDIVRVLAADPPRAPALSPAADLSRGG